MTITCSECNIAFKNTWNLKRHVIKKHPDKITQLVTQTYKNNSNYQFLCMVCGKNFNKKHHLTFHEKNHKITQENNVNNKRKCPLCMYCNQSKKVLLTHFQEDHNIEIVPEYRSFITSVDFNEWKMKIERTSKCKYVNVFSKLNSGKTYIHYECHRSGLFTSKGNGIRHLKTQGSDKIGAFCPANIKFLKDEEGKCSATFMLKHVGHTNDLGHLYLTAEERKQLAVKIASKIPFDTILDSIRSSVSNDEIERIHLVTRKDLYNIECSYNLNYDSVRHANDAISIESWVLEMQETTNCVLYYKPQEKLDEKYNQFKPNDFVLIIMNEAQCELLKKYGTDSICIDSTHGLNSYGFELVTVMVLDDMRQGFPCAFLISNRIDEEVLKVFFSCIRDRTECLQSKVFMSDMAECFYNAWLQIMGAAQYRLFCTWHVDRAWRNNLKKIKSQEKQALVYKQLRTILVELEEETFLKILQEFLNILAQDPDTEEFGNYFQTYYIPRYQNWAYCYRAYAGINTNMHIENMHKILKHIYLKGKTVKRLDKAICALMKFVRDKLFDRLIVLNKGKISSKLKDIRSRHKKSLELDKDLLIKTEIGWEIKTTKNNICSMYYLQENKDFRDCQCQLVCLNCKSCIHKYTCSCIDHCIKWNMCKHIHLLCQTWKLNDVPQVTNMDVPLEVHVQSHISINEHVLEQQQIVAEIATSNKTKNEHWFREKKEQIKQKLLNMVNILDNINAPNELNEFEKIITPFEPTWEAVKANYKFSQNENKPVPHNKKIIGQRRLFSTRKYKQKISTRSIRVPTSVEAQSVLISLLNNST